MHSAANQVSDKLKLPVFNIFVIALVAIIGLYYNSIDSLMVEWGSSLYSHGWLVTLVFLYTLYRKSEFVPLQSLLHRLPGLLVIAASALVWWFASITNILTLQFLALYGLVFGVIWGIWGWAMLLNMRYILVALALAMPLWQLFQAPLRSLTAHVSYQFIQFAGVPVLLEKYTLTLPGGRFHVERSCAGLSFVLTGTSLVFIFAAWQSLKFQALIRLLVLSTVIAIVANWIRVIVIVLIGNHTNMQSEIVKDHLTFGWILFALFYCPLFWFMIRRLSSRLDATVAEYLPSEPTEKQHNVALVLIMFILLAIFPGIHAYISVEKAPSKLSTVQAVLDASYRKNQENIDAWKPTLSRIDNEIAYFDESREIHLYIGENRSFGSSIETIGSHTTLYDEDKWRLLDEAENGKIGSLVVAGDKRKRVIVFTFVVAGERMVSISEARKGMLSAYFSRDPNLFVLGLMKEVFMHANTERVESELRSTLNDLSAALLSEINEQ